MPDELTIVGLVLLFAFAIGGLLLMALDRWGPYGR